MEKMRLSPKIIHNVKKIGKNNTVEHSIGLEDSSERPKSGFERRKKVDWRGDSFVDDT